MATVKKLQVQPKPKTVGVGASTKKPAEKSTWQKIKDYAKYVVEANAKADSAAVRHQSDVMLKIGDKLGLGNKPKKQRIGGKVKKIKTAKSGASLGMKSVKSGYDKNPGVTRADFVSIGKGQAKKGAKVSSKKKMMGGGKCKYGCK
jgi:hypothetical protein